MRGLGFPHKKSSYAPISSHLYGQLQDQLRQWINPKDKRHLQAFLRTSPLRYYRCLEVQK